MTQPTDNRSPHFLATILLPPAPTEDLAGVSRSTTPKRTYTDTFAGDVKPNLQPSSPTQQRVSIDTAAKSPDTPGADVGVGSMRDGSEEKKPQKMVRSSIACARCRRSKVKCVNEGITTRCKACVSAGRECQYPTSGSTATPKRSETTGNSKQEERENKRRVRKVEDVGRSDSTRVEDPLESTILSKKVWDEIYELFKLHYSTEMPFLHPPTFRHRMRQVCHPRDPLLPPPDLRDGRVLLLGVLTLTARFHPDLVSYHTQITKSSDPQVASEHYAIALKKAFDLSGTHLTTPSIDGVQALLMLGLYEWGESRGLSAWVYVGVAIRLAQSMGLAYEDGVEYRTFRASPLRKRVHSIRENAIERETRRRTLWSCFGMDRMLSAGKCRPTMFALNQLQVQLPCSDDEYLFVKDVSTGFLDPEARPDSNMNDDRVLSWYIRLVEIFGRFSEWSFAGGRRNETLPPWDKGAQFYQLRQELESFARNLPPNMTFTEANLSAHIEKRNATTYASLHTLYSLCLIMLHREYIPFIPLRCRKPVGPLDEPLILDKDYAIPEGFWEESASTLFKTARDTMEIIQTCQESNALPESPQTGFAVWQAAFVCIYAVYFPHMDLDQHLVTAVSGKDGTMYESKGFDGLTVKILGELLPRLQMAAGYLNMAHKMKSYFTNAKVEFNRRFGEPSWTGGGLEQYKTFEKDLKEFGTLQDPERNTTSDGSDTLNDGRSRASTNDTGHGSVSGEAMQGVETASTPGQSWAAVNQDSTGATYDPNYQRSPAQNSAPSNIVSPGQATSSINSPYATNQSYSNMGIDQRISRYEPVGQQVLPIAPPSAPGEVRNSGDWALEDNATWINRMEGIDACAHFDNLSQQGFPEGSFQDMTGEFNNNQNYITALAMWNVPHMTEAERAEFY